MEPAAADQARRKIKRASGLLRDAARDLARAQDQTTVGVHRVNTPGDADQALDLIRVGAARYGAVDVIVIARPRGRDQHTHHDPPPGG